MVLPVREDQPQPGRSEHQRERRRTPDQPVQDEGGEARDVENGDRSGEEDLTVAAALALKSETQNEKDGTDPGPRRNTNGRSDPALIDRVPEQVGQS